MEIASEIMTPDPIKVRVDDTVEACLERMERQGVRHLPVVDKEGILAGILTRYALHLAKPGQHAHRAMVPATGVGEDTELATALRALRNTTQDAIVVTNAHRHPVGLITEHDAVKLAPALLAQNVLAIRRPGRDLVTVHPDESITEAFDRMIEHQIRHLPVVEGPAILAVISLRDLLDAGVTRNRNGTVRDIIEEGEVHVVIEGTPLVDVATRMAKRRIGCLPIMDFAHRPVGIVTRADLIELVIASELGGTDLPEVWSHLGPP